jgi:AraC-like DNA-binding protein
VALPSLLDLLLVYMIRAWMTETTSGAWPRALGDPATAAALRAMHAEPAAPWSNDRLAAEAGVSRPTLARRFATLVGRVGYSSPYALSHAFEREFGTTPGRYRAQAAVRSTS